MPRILRKKIGFVTLTNDGRGYKIRYKDPLTKRDVRRVLCAQNDKEAVQYCWEFNRSITGARGMVPSQKAQFQEMDVSSAILEAVKSSDGNHSTLRRYINDANMFISFLDKRFPEVMGWVHVKPSVLKSYLKELNASGLAFDTIRLRLEPIRRTSSYWAAEEPDKYKDIFKLAQIKLKRPLPKEIPAISLDTLYSIIDWPLSNEYKQMAVLAALQGLAGLRVYEACMLRYKDVDFVNETVTIDEVAWHKPKNLASYRTIPVAGFALQLLRDYCFGQKVQPADSTETIFRNRRGGKFSANGISKEWLKIFKAMRKDQIIPEKFTAQNFRHTFASAVMPQGASEFYVKKYMGHSHGGILGRHYVLISISDLKSGVVCHIEKAWQESGSANHNTLKILNL